MSSRRRPPAVLAERPPAMQGLSPTWICSLRLVASRILVLGFIGI